MSKRKKENLLEDIGGSPRFIEGFKAPVIIKTKEPEVTFRQSRSYLKTTAKLVGKDTSTEPTLFSLPTVITTPEEGGNFIRDVISKNTSILGQIILNLWQLNKNEKEELEITNISELGKFIGVSNFEIKMYLLYLGGYTYPLISSGVDKIDLSMEQLFKVTFTYLKKDLKNKYSVGQLERVGNSVTSFIKNEKPTVITIKPNIKFIDDIAGKGLGNIRVTEKYIKLALGLTDIAYKLLNYTSSNKSPLTISEDRLIIWLGLEKQIKKQGKPRIRETILKGLKELRDKEHIKEFSQDNRFMFTLISSDNFIRRKVIKK